MIVEVLGSGTSTGVPVPGCPCRVCQSDDRKNKRLRTSIHLTLEARDREAPPGPDERPTFSILIDTSPDLRYQSLRSGITRVDSVLFTHSHADHIFGLDDLRSFNFVNSCTIPIYADSATAADLVVRFDYAFKENPLYEGGSPPRLEMTEIEPFVPLELWGVRILPLRLHHGSLPILGYRIGGFAYLTDCSRIPDETRPYLEGLELLIIDGLRKRPHKTHFTHEQAVREVERIAPKRAFLTHISHEIDHGEGNDEIRTMSGRQVELAYDGLRYEL